MKPKVVLYKDVNPTQVTLNGLVDSSGKFWYKDEHMAKWASCTHVDCTRCKRPTPKTYLLCEDCRKFNDAKKYRSFPVKEWDGKNPLFSNSVDRWYFEGIEEVLEDLDSLELDNIIDLQLLLSEPVYYPELDLANFLDDAPEDLNIPNSVIQAVETFNNTISNIKEPMYWKPINVRPDLSKLV